MDASCDLRAFQSVLSQLGVGGGGRSKGAESSMVMGTWSDPVDRREDSQLWKKVLAVVNSKLSRVILGVVFDLGEYVRKTRKVLYSLELLRAQCRIE